MTADFLLSLAQAITKGLLTGGSLIVSTGEEGGSVTCKVSVNGQPTKTETANGQFAVATCSNF